MDDSADKSRFHELIRGSLSYKFGVFHSDVYKNNR